MEQEYKSRSQSPSASNQPSTGISPQGTWTSPHRTSGTPPQSHRTPPPTSTPSTPSAQATGSLTTSGATNPRRRRGPGIVTPNACTECRKKRAKCDGTQPCGRCRAQKDIECIYEVPVRQSKESLRMELEYLRSRQRSYDSVLAALISPQLWEVVLDRLHRGQDVEDISHWLEDTLPLDGGIMPDLPRQDQSYIDSGPYMTSQLHSDAPIPEDIAAMNLGANTNLAGPPGPRPPPIVRNEVGQESPWLNTWGVSDSSRGTGAGLTNWQLDLSGPPQSRVGFWGGSIKQEQISGPIPKFRGLEEISSPLEPGAKSSSGSWTRITGDNNLVRHLLTLYFCWEYPTFASLSKVHFLRDFHDRRHRYCSPILVNALLALGCRFSTQPASRANPSDPYSSGDHFFKESQRLLNQETDYHSLPTIQALGIMSIREASCGRDSESWYYAGQSIRLALEMSLHYTSNQGDEDKLAVQSATFWGAFALDHAWSLATGSLPQCSSLPYLPPKPAIIDYVEASLWVPYTDDGAPLQRSCEQPSNVRSVYKCFCELSELVHQSLYILHPPGRPLIARDLLSMYTQYLDWYNRIPEVLRLGHNFTPSVLFAHMYYHFAILLLFRPLIKLRIIGSVISPRDVCCQAADAIQGLLRSYSQLYTLQRTPSFMPYFVLTSALMHLIIHTLNTSDNYQHLTTKNLETAVELDTRVLGSLKQGILDLTEMAPCHRFAGQALNILRYLADKWNVEVDIESDKFAPEAFDKIVKPNTRSLNFFAPNVQEGDFICDWSTAPRTQRSEDTEAYEAATAQNAGDTMDNTLFWPFPMQGRPMLPAGKELEQAGFALL